MAKVTSPGYRDVEFAVFLNKEDRRSPRDLGAAIARRLPDACFEHREANEHEGGGLSVRGSQLQRLLTHEVLRDLLTEQGERLSISPWLVQTPQQSSTSPIYEKNFFNFVVHVSIEPCRYDDSATCQCGGDYTVANVQEQVRGFYCDDVALYQDFISEGQARTMFSVSHLEDEITVPSSSTLLAVCKDVFGSLVETHRVEDHTVFLTGAQLGRLLESTALRRILQKKTDWLCIYLLHVEGRDLYVSFEPTAEIEYRALTQIV